MKAKTLYWTPRIITILAILFMMLFSFDVFGEEVSLGKKLLGFLMHNIPVIILTIVLIIAWKWENIGGILLIVTFIATGILFHSFSGNSASLIIITPFLITGILFLLHYYLYGKKSGQSDHAS